MRRTIRILYLLSGLWMLYQCTTFFTNHYSIDKEAQHTTAYQYFHDSNIFSKTHRLGAVSHCDSRYVSNKSMSVEEMQITLKALLSSYTTYMQGIEIQTWLAHGTLLGWYWNRQLLPWDTDLDVQISSNDLSKLIQHNMSEFTALKSTELGNCSYLLDVNPHSSLVSLRDAANRIDGRWIDMTNGKFIDITIVHKENGPEADKGSLFCKDGHRYKAQKLFPLRGTHMEGIEVLVPADTEDVLRDEYGERAMKNTRFHWHVFNPTKQAWEFLEK